jgi:hypothetical protein
MTGAAQRKAAPCLCRLPGSDISEAVNSSLLLFSVGCFMAHPGLRMTKLRLKSAQNLLHRGARGLCNYALRIV